MKKYIFGLLMALFLMLGFQVESSPLSNTKYDVPGTKYEATAITSTSSSMEVLASLEVYRSLGYELPSLVEIEEALGHKVAIYSVPLPDENKIVLVRDPKNFIISAIRHGMKFIAIKPMDKGEYWETVPVFSTESSVSFKPGHTVEPASDELMELIRTVAVSDFLRYN